MRNQVYKPKNRLRGKYEKARYIYIYIYEDADALNKGLFASKFVIFQIQMGVIKKKRLKLKSRC